jgi:FkbM family methyltransferase
MANGTKIGARRSGLGQKTAKIAKLVTPPILYSLMQRLFAPKSAFAYKYPDYSIILPPNHLLPAYQEKFPKYDRFLPHLASYMAPSATIIDIGANVGDTLAGMVAKNAASTYVCIEPDDVFFGFLTRNIETMKRAKQNLVVHAVKSLVGKAVTGVSLEGKGGTKRAVISEGGAILSKTLDVILSELPGIANVRLLKSDVDGFDYDVLDSSMVVIRQNKPLIFFECQYFFEYQKDGFGRTLRTLQGEGYYDWVVFDNFGEVVVRTRDLDIITKLLDYVWQQNIEKAPRTIYYYDILAVQSADITLIDTVLATYA